MAPGVAEPDSHVLRQLVRLAQSDDAYVVDHLRPDKHVVGVLHDREVVVVRPGGRHRRAEHTGGARSVVDDATLGERPQFGMIVQGELGSELVVVVFSLLALRRKRRDAAVGRPRDERRSRLSVDHRHPVAAIEVDLVVSPDAARHPGCGAVRVTCLEAPVDPRPLPTGNTVDLGPRVYRARALRPLEGRECHVAPVALEVGMAPGGPGRIPVRIPARGPVLRQRIDREQEPHRYDCESENEKLRGARDHDSSLP